MLDNEGYLARRRLNKVANYQVDSPGLGWEIPPISHWVVSLFMPAWRKSSVRLDCRGLHVKLTGAEICRCRPGSLIAYRPRVEVVLKNVIDKGPIMKSLKKLALAPIAAALIASAAPASANMLTFQGVRFDTIASGNMLTLVITNALSGGTGNWTNINWLSAFEIKNIGNITGVTLGSGFDSSWNYTTADGVSSSSGCTAGSTPGACFFSVPAEALSDSMSFTMTFSGSNIDFSAPSLKVRFLKGLYDAHAQGDLLSATLPVPEPEIYALMAIGLGVLGWRVSRKKLKEAAAA